MAGAEDDKKTKGHSMTDHHGMGPGWKHEHDGYADHDHDEYDMDGPIEDNPLWQADNVHLTSVGVDIGSSGTQVIFSRIHLRRLGEDLTSRYYVVSRDTIYLSPVSLTPYASETRIDDVKLGEIIKAAYEGAGLKASEVDTGAVCGSSVMVKAHLFLRIEKSPDPSGGRLEEQGGVGFFLS